MDLDSFAATKTDLAGFYQTAPQTKPRSTKRPRLDLPQPQSGDRFIKGPIPLEWMKLASRCGYRSEAVALLLWYLAGWQRSNPVKLTPDTLAEFRVHPKTAKRILLSFESAGLVSVEFRRGCSPVVTLLALSPTLSGD